MYNVPSIPEPGNTLESIAETVRALKQVSEILTGAVGEPGDKAAHLYVQAESPKRPHSGCIWVDTGNGNRAFAWNGSQWVAVAALVSPDEPPDPADPPFDCKLLASGTYNGAALDLALPSGYMNFRLEIRQYRPTVNGEALAIRFSKDGGTTYLADSYYWSWMYSHHGATTVGSGNQTSAGAGANTAIFPSWSQSNVSTYCHGTINIEKGNATAIPGIRSSIIYYDGSYVLHMICGGIHSTAGEATHMRLTYGGGGGIANIQYALYGNRI